ncbi:MAG TPA: nuclear transport factor 2 family protein [Candidatus Acidoferrum sp.]|nr:nuclear transport factor 2 family protein [Candidatus Acidoferrum sp.]
MTKAPTATNIQPSGFLPRSWRAAAGLALGLILTAMAAAGATPQQQMLDELPQAWAHAATVGDVDKLVALYSPEAFIHVVFTQEELRGEKAIRAYYAKYEKQSPKVTITSTDENTILNGTIGILSGYAKVEFPGQQPMTTHFSIVGQWQNDRWYIQIQTTVKVN